MRTRRRRLLWPLALLLCGSGLVFAQESANYKIKSLSITIAADETSSPSFDNAITAVTVSGATGVCAGGTTATLGFWSLLGAQEVPFLLAVDKVATIPINVQLNWSGQSSEFTVYRSASPTNVVSPSNALVTTSLCEETDTTASASNLFFYKVEPGAP